MKFCPIHQKNTCKSYLQFEFDHLDWISNFYSEWRQTSKLVNLKISAEVRVCDSGQNLKMTKTSEFCSIHEENNCKSSLHLNLINLTDFQSFTLTEDKVQNQSIVKFSTKVFACDFGQNLKMAKSSSFFFIHQENTCKSSLHLNFIILTDFHSLTAKEDKLQN